VRECVFICKFDNFDEVGDGEKGKSKTKR